MSLLNSVANREIMDFLRTLTIKSTYFADKIRSTQIQSAVSDRVPETANPYIIHLAGHYILSDIITVNNREKHDDRFWRSQDRERNKFKNYWRLVDTTFQRLSADEMETISDPWKAGLWEIKPFVVEDVVDPVTGLKEDQYYYRSQMIYGREGYLSEEARNDEIYTDDVYDEMMYVTSLDTQQTIPFTLENFYLEEANEAVAQGRRKNNSIHSKTLEAYRIPGRYFDLLCKRYPKQVDLIKAIVYRVPGHEISSLVTIPELENQLLQSKYATPEYIASLETRFPNKYDLLKKLGADLEGSRDRSGMNLAEYRRTRIAKAKNFELLNYDYTQLDETEQISLLEHTKKVLSIMSRRWAVNEFNFEENYAAVLWSVLWSVLPTSLIAKRYANIKTPYVSEGHMWDYLNSKGLADYRGYLTTKQTWFLYKNIEYLLQHAGQQKALNILIDNLLADYGLTIKAKTVVLDTTDSLSYGATPTDPAVQCQTCSRCGVSCFKNMTEHLCEEWLGTKTLCKADPVVLTEDFAGASQAKIIRRLVNDYGYTEEKALIKYKRSFIWKDDDIESIKDDLNRDQMVDLDAHVDTLEDTITAEHASDLEPVVSDDIVAQQRKELQYMHGTYAPTKLLEITQQQYNVKFTELFNRFITDTFMRFAPRVNDDGTVTRKVTCSYSFTTTEGAASYLFNFGEMLAAGYLGFVREYTVDALVDSIDKTAEGKPLYELVLDEEGKPIQIDTDAEGNPVYLKKLSYWAQRRFTDLANKVSYDFDIPDRCRTTTALRFGRPVRQSDLVHEWNNFDGTGQEALEEYVESTDTKAKEGKQYYLKTDDTYTKVDVEVGSDISEKGYYQDKVPNKDSNTRIITITYDTDQSTKYAVTRLDEPDTFCLTPDTVAKADKIYYTKGDDGYVVADVSAGDTLKSGTYYEEDSIWGEFTVRLKILGEFVMETVGSKQVYTYYENNDEVPIIPKFFKWYYTHMNPDIDATEEEKAEMEVSVKLAQKPIWVSGAVDHYESLETNAENDDDTNQAFVNQDPNDPKHQEKIQYFDPDRGQEYRLFALDQFLDVSSLIKRWVDVMGRIDDQSVISNYIDVMFEILEEVYCFASASCSARTHLACRTFLDCIIKQDSFHFDLTGIDKTHDNTEGGKSAWYSEWLATDKELLGSFNIIDKLLDTSVGWNEFNTAIVKKLLEGCTIQYAQEAVTKTQYAKLKQLVRSLSSYRINFIDNAETGQICNDTACITEDTLIDQIDNTEIIYFDAIGDSLIPPRVGGYENVDSEGCIVVPTQDLRRVEGKTYYALTYADSTVYDNPDSRQVWHPVARPLGTKGEDVPEGQVLTVGAEAINLPATDEFQFYRQTEDKFVLKDKNYYKFVALTQRYVKVDETYFTSVKTSEVTEELPADVLKDTDESGNEIVYRIAVAFEEIAVGDRLPTGRCFEKINLYTILGIKEGTPLLISKVDNKWYYTTGTTRTTEYRLTGDTTRRTQKQYYIYVGYNIYRPTVDDDFDDDGAFVTGTEYFELSVTPASAANVNDSNFNTDMYEAGDRFDLNNDFSNETAKLVLDSVIYRVNVPIDCVDWDTPKQSLVLEKWLYPNVNHEFILTEFTEPSILIQESEYPEKSE